MTDIIIKNKHCIIYKLTSPSGKSYIGQTQLTLKDRLHIHKNSAKRFAKNPNVKCCRALCAAINKYKIENFTVETLFDNPNWTFKELLEMETKMILEHNTLSPNGYNLTTGGEGVGSHSNETKLLMKQNIPIGISNNINSYRDHNEELEGCPKHVVWYEKGLIRGYRINNFRINGILVCKNLRFTSKTEPLNVLKKRCLDYLKNLELSNQHHKSNQMLKKESGLAKGITKRKNFYECSFVYKGITYNKCFTLYEDALDWITNKRISVKM